MGVCQGSVEFMYHKRTGDIFSPCIFYDTTLIKLTKEEAYLIGEFLHEHNN